MSDFVNTIDKYGDQETLEKVFDGSLDEYCDDAITTIGYISSSSGSRFYALPNLKYVNMPNLEDASSHLFNGCNRLEVCKIPKAKSINGTFNRCVSLVSVDVSSATSLGSYAFYYCSSLTSLSLPKVTSIGSNIFTNCSSLIDLNIPNVTSISGNFSGCNSLRTLTIPKCQDVGSSCFSGLVSLDTVILPSLVRFNGGAIFSRSANLSTLVLGGDSVVPSDWSNNLEGTKIASNNGYIYVRSNLVDTYKSATNWSNYATRIMPIGGEITITNNSNTITIACANPDASIKYVVNGGDEQEYTAPFSINEGDVVYACAEKFGVVDGEAFVNLNADSIGGKISYVSSEDNGATYHFYRANGSEITGWNTKDDLADAIYYTKTGESASDRFYVFGDGKNIERMIGSSRYVMNRGYFCWNVSASGVDLSDIDTTKGKQLTEKYMLYSNGGLIASPVDNSASYPTIWYLLKCYREDTGVNDWYIPSIEEIAKFGSIPSSYISYDGSFWSSSLASSGRAYTSNTNGARTQTTWGTYCALFAVRSF